MLVSSSRLLEKVHHSVALGQGTINHSSPVGESSQQDPIGN
jgi:hypothetical protein